MRDKQKSRWLQSCRLTLSALALGQFIATPVLAEPLFPGFPGFPPASPSRSAFRAAADTNRRRRSSM